MSDYAMIRYENNTVRRVVKGKKPHKNARIVEYPKLNVTNLTHDISEASLDKWEVLDDKVIAKYNIKKKDFEKEKEDVLYAIKSKIKEKYKNTIIYKGHIIEINDTIINRLLLKKIILESDKSKVVNWKINKDVLKLNYDNVMELLTLIDDKLNQYFDEYSEIVDQINKLEIDDFEGLNNINKKF